MLKNISSLHERPAWSRGVCPPGTSAHAGNTASTAGSAVLVNGFSDVQTSIAQSTFAGNSGPSAVCIYGTTLASGAPKASGVEGLTPTQAPYPSSGDCSAYLTQA